MKSRVRGLLVLLVIFAALVGLYFFKYHLGAASELWSRPCADSRDPHAKLLVGKWQGHFADPAGVDKNMVLEILPPVSEEERQERAARKTRKKRSRENKQAFDGSAIVTSSLGQERYDIYGSVDKTDIHQLSFHFTPQDETKRVLPNDTLHEPMRGRWQGDSLSIVLTFNRQDEQGFSSSHSEGVVVNGQLVWQDSAEDKEVEVALSRLPP
jgi:hypothetical protein